MLKRFCRWILSDEIGNLNQKLEAESDRAERLADRLRPHLPELKPDGTCQADNLQFILDVNQSAKIDMGMYTVATTVVLGDGATIKGEV
ncbi:hypothetical protein VPHF99_0225 [Vibrio phage F99]